MFQTVFSPSPDEACALLDYVRYLWDERIGEQIGAHPLYRPSALWKQWAGQTFAGFSLEKILLQGGHAFPSSVEVGTEEGGERGGVSWRRCLAELFRGRTLDRNRRGRDPVQLQQWFRRFYPQVAVYPEHERWYAWHPNPYFRCLEAYVLRAKIPLPQTMLEVGAGACVNVAFYRSLNPAMQATVVDLPETIVFGYCFLKSVFPDIRLALPNEAGLGQTGRQADVRFLLPTQVDFVPERSVDFCCNMSSFQEMTIETVNHYLRFMSRVLKPGGTMLSANLESSRYLEGNALDNYDYALYHATPHRQPAPFATDLIGPIEGLNIVHAEVMQRIPAGGADAS